MSLQAFQEALSQMVMSPVFRNRVAEDADGALSGFDLSSRERLRLEGLAKDPGLRTGTLLHRSTRLSMLSNTLPRTCRALGSRGLKEMTHLYWSEHPPHSSIYIQEGLRFGEFALAQIRAGRFQNDVLEEVLETEMAVLVLGATELAWEPPGSGVLPPEPESWVPCLHALCRVVRFRHDPDVLLPALEQGRVPEGLPEGEHCLLLFASAPGQVAMRHVPPEQGRALLACDGSSTVASLCARTGLPLRVFEELFAAGFLWA